MIIWKETPSPLTPYHKKEIIFAWFPIFVTNKKTNLTELVWLEKILHEYGEFAYDDRYTMPITYSRYYKLEKDAK